MKQKTRKHRNAPYNKNKARRHDQQNSTSDMPALQETILSEFDKVIFISAFDFSVNGMLVRANHLVAIAAAQKQTSTVGKEELDTQQKEEEEEQAEENPSLLST